MFSDLQLFGMFNIDCHRQTVKPTMGEAVMPLMFPTSKPLWTFKTRTDRAQYRGKTTDTDKAPHLPGKPGSAERIAFLTEYYANDDTETSPF